MSLGKTFEIQTKTIEYHREKQIKAIEDNKKQLDSKARLDNNKLLLPKERELIKNIYHKRLNKIDESSKKIDFVALKFIVNSSGLETDFSELKDPVAVLDSIKIHEILIEEV